MKDFVQAALPWVAMGVLIAFLLVRKFGPNKRPEKDYSAEGMSIGMCLGCAIGAAGVMRIENGLWIGMLIGMLAGMAKEKKPSENEDVDEEKKE